MAHNILHPTAAARTHDSAHMIPRVSAHTTHSAHDVPPVGAYARTHASAYTMIHDGMTRDLAHASALTTHAMTEQQGMRTSTQKGLHTPAPWLTPAHMPYPTTTPTPYPTP